MERDYLKITGRAAIVTGSGRGIGRATARALANYGVRVMEIRENGGIAEYCHCDVADTLQVKEMVKVTVEAFGTVDILVNNAGIGSVSLPFEEITDEQWEQMIKVDLTAPFYVCREVIPYMKEQKHGKIINISSGSGIIGCEFALIMHLQKQG